MAWPDEAAEVVHMAIGVLICMQAQGQPEDFLDGQHAGQLSLNILLGHMGIAVLMQQALLCCQQRSAMQMQTGLSCLVIA